MIKGKGKMRKLCGILYAEEFEAACLKLPDNKDYLFLIADESKNRKLPYTTYLFSVVLPFISRQLPDHPSSTALYKFFEHKFAPVHPCTINGIPTRYQEIKSEKSVDVNNFIERVVEYALKEWSIDIPSTDELSQPANREFQSQAYLNQEVDWNSFVSLRTKKSKDNERRNENDECV